ncbi:MAG TPA: Blp family class II bacteriocin [Planctomycetota bacterium]|jgi:uncharacterized membrane protein|nr:Blp family class II bacteriocin [Planctomycetota bacterium]
MKKNELVVEGLVELDAKSLATVNGGSCVTDGGAFGAALGATYGAIFGGGLPGAIVGAVAGAVGGAIGACSASH